MCVLQRYSSHWDVPPEWWDPANVVSVVQFDDVICAHFLWDIRVDWGWFSTSEFDFISEFPLKWWVKILDTNSFKELSVTEVFYTGNDALVFMYWEQKCPFNYPVLPSQGSLSPSYIPQILPILLEIAEILLSRGLCPPLPSKVLCPFLNSQSSHHPAISSFFVELGHLFHWWDQYLDILLFNFYTSLYIWFPSLE